MLTVLPALELIEHTLGERPEGNNLLLKDKHVHICIVHKNLGKFELFIVKL